jgi:hypothetical protein
VDALGALRTKWRTPLSRYLIAVIVSHWLLLGVYFRNGMGGHSYGPRLFTDLTPFFIFFLIRAGEGARWGKLALRTAARLRRIVLLRRLCGGTRFPRRMKPASGIGAIYSSCENSFPLNSSGKSHSGLHGALLD